MGTYELQKQRHNNKAVYKCGRFYLYKTGADWTVGVSVGSSDSVFMCVKDDAVTPDQITYSWEVPSDDGGWEMDSGAKATCKGRHHHQLGVSLFFLCGKFFFFF
jgi:hypothetical protein